MNRYIVHDTLEVFLEDIDSGDTYFFGLTNSATINKEVMQEPIRAGIHNKVVGMIQADEGMTVDVTVGMHYDELYEIQTGSQFEEDAITVQKVVENPDGTFTAIDDEVTGNVLDLSAEKLPRNYKLQLKGIGYDEETNQIKCDVYYLFDKALPNGNIADTFEAGTNKTSEITFTLQIPRGSDSYGKYVVVPR